MLPGGAPLTAPLVTSPVRAAVLARVAAGVPAAADDGCVRVAVDGVDGAGKSVFADELGEALAALGRPVLRASVDGVHHPRAVRHRRGRESPVGCWLDSYDYPRLRAELLDPLGPGGDRRVRRAVHEVGSDRALPSEPEGVPPGTVLVLDGIFLHREELAGYWDLSVWLAVRPAVAARRMASRDGSPPDPADPRNRRYVLAQRYYRDACAPERRATLVVDNDDLARPRLRTNNEK